MGASATALESFRRASDGRWVTLGKPVDELVGVTVRRITEDEETVVVLVHHPRNELARLLGGLLVAPPAVAGDGVLPGWPVDLVTDVADVTVGYLARVRPPGHWMPLADLADLHARADHPQLTWRHLVRAARRAAAILGAIHAAGHGGLGVDAWVIDGQAHVVLDRADTLGPATYTALEADEHRFADLLVALLGDVVPRGAVEPLDELDAGSVGTPLHIVPTAARWHAALRKAEGDLADCPDEPLHARLLGRPCTRCPATPASTRDRPAAVWLAPGPDPSADPLRALRERQAARLAQREAVGRGIFSAAAGISAGALLSMAPFATYLAFAVVVLPLAAAARSAGRRQGRSGRARLALGTVGRLGPSTLGVVPLAALLFLTLVFTFALVLSVAAVFGYGPGLRMTFLTDVAEVPGLLRAFCFALGAFAGGVAGADAHRAARTAGRGPRFLAAPAAVVSMGALLAAAAIPFTWWPLPAQ